MQLDDGTENGGARRTRTFVVPKGHRIYSPGQLPLCHCSKLGGPARIRTAIARFVIWNSFQLSYGTELAEKVGFEPTVPFTARPSSSRTSSASRAFLRGAQRKDRTSVSRFGGGRSTTDLTAQKFGWEATTRTWIAESKAQRPTFGRLPSWLRTLELNQIRPSL